MSSSYIWIDSTSWELEFFGLPSRIPWPADIDATKASEDPFDHAELARAIEMMGADAPEPFKGYLAATDNFDALAEVLEDSEFPEAATLLDEVEAVLPGTAFVAFHRGIVARQDGLYEDAIRHFETAAQRTPRIGMIWLQLGTLLAQEGERDRAIAALNNAVRINPNDVEAYEVLATLKAAVKVMRDAKDPKSVSYIGIAKYRELCAQQFEQLRNNHAGLLEFAEFQLRNHFIPELGVQALELARQLQPDDPRTLAALSNSYRIVGDHERAKTVANDLAERFATEPQAWLNLAQILAASGDPDGERAALDTTLTLDPNTAPALVRFFGLADGPNADAEPRLAAFGAEKASPLAFLLASNSARDRGEKQLALDYAAHAFKLAPEREEVLLHYCATIGDAKDDKRLKRDIEPVVNSEKATIRLHWNYAQALKQLGREQEAINALITTASAENVPDDFQHAVVSTIDMWTHRLAQGEVALAINKAGALARPIVLSLEREDGAVLLKAGQPLPAETQFPWRVRLNGDGETCVTLQQGQSGGDVHPMQLGSFAVKVPPVTGGAHTIHCLLGTGPDARLLFKAVQGARELQVRWVAPSPHH
ncbi:MAG: tetratricopeptide repeat protein [Chthoniobacteraceae bacterium]